MSSGEDEPKRVRVTKACEGCKTSRRKCSGESPCDHCIKRGIECVFDEEPPKKRGPKGGRATMLEAENAALKAELDRLRAAAAQQGVALPGNASAMTHAGSTGGAGTKRKPSAALSVVAMPAGKRVAGSARAAIPTWSEGSVWTIDGPISVDDTERSTLDAFFQYTNKMLPVVDKDAFYAALEDFGSTSAPVSGVRAADGDVDGPQGLANVALRSEAFGFRVLLYTVLCAGSKVLGRVKEAKHYYGLARAFIGPCFSVPSQHLVSALLVMTLITRGLCHDNNQAAVHAALAQRMCDLVPVSPELRTAATVLSYANTPGNALPSPPPEKAPHGTDPHRRFADILGWAISVIIQDSVQAQRQSKTVFLAQLEEAVAIQQATGVFKDFPLKVLVAGMRAMAQYRDKEYAAALVAARDCIHEATVHPLSRVCYPVVLIVAKLMPIVKVLVAMPESAALLHGEEQAQGLPRTACRFLISSDSSFSVSRSVEAGKAICTDCGEQPEEEEGGGCPAAEDLEDEDAHMAGACGQGGFLPPVHVLEPTADEPCPALAAAKARANAELAAAAAAAESAARSKASTAKKQKETKPTRGSAAVSGGSSGRAGGSGGSGSTAHHGSPAAHLPKLKVREEELVRASASMFPRLHPPPLVVNTSGSGGGAGGFGFGSGALSASATPLNTAFPAPHAIPELDSTYASNMGALTPLVDAGGASQLRGGFGADYSSSAGGWSDDESFNGLIESAYGDLSEYFDALPDAKSTTSGEDTSSISRAVSSPVSSVSMRSSEGASASSSSRRGAGKGDHGVAAAAAAASRATAAASSSSAAAAAAAPASSTSLLSPELTASAWPDTDASGVGDFLGPSFSTLLSQFPVPLNEAALANF